MPTYTVTAPDGHVVTFDGPAGMKQTDIVARAKQERGFNEGTIATEPSAWSRFSSGLLSTLPNPSDVMNAFLHPIDTARAYARNQIEHPFAAATDAAFPLTPGASQAVHAGSEVGKGNVAGGMGELAGLIAPDVLPEVPGAVAAGVRGAGRATSAVGRGMETVGAASKKLSPLGFIGDLAYSHNPVAATAVAAAPYAAEYGGKGLQRLGNAMQGLGADSPEIAGAIERYGPPARSRVSREVPGSSFAEPPTAPTPSPVTSEGLKEQPLYQHLDYVPSTPAAPPSLEGLTPKEPSLNGFARGPKIEGSTIPSTATADQRALFDRFVAGNDAPVAAPETPTEIPPPPALPNSPVRANTPTYTLNDSPADIAASAPAGATPIPNAMSPRLAGQAPGLNDELQKIMESLAAEHEAGGFGDTPSVRSVDRGNMVTNGSGESAASQESINRFNGMKANGQKFAKVDRAGRITEFPTGDYVDYSARPGESFGTVDANGNFSVLDNNGGRVRPTVPSDSGVPTIPSMPLDRLKRILSTFENPDTATPFDESLRDLILTDPNGAEFNKAYGPSGRR